MAMQACATGSPPAEGSACQRLAAEDWIAADPAHAEPWLRLAEQEQEHTDAELADEAFRRALALPFGRLAEQSLLGAVQAAQPADAGVLEKLQMGEALAALRGGWREHQRCRLAVRLGAGLQRLEPARHHRPRALGAQAACRQVRPVATDRHAAQAAHTHIGRRAQGFDGRSSRCLLGGG